MRHSGNVLVRTLGASYGRQPLPEWFNQKVQLVQRHMLREVWGCESVLRPLCVRAVASGRKLRASIALQFSKWGGLTDGRVQLEVVSSNLVPVEFLHAASCILDDVIDGDRVRRGQPVFYVREGLP